MSPVPSAERRPCAPLPFLGAAARQGPVWRRALGDPTDPVADVLAAQPQAPGPLTGANARAPRSTAARPLGGETVHRSSEVTALTPPGDTHRVRDTGDGPGVSVHVYGTDTTRQGSRNHHITA
jgi:hypothetical protein